MTWTHRLAAPLLVALALAGPARAAVIVKGPWLQDVRPDGITVVWEMDELIPADASDAPRVELGPGSTYDRRVGATGALVQDEWPVYRAVVDGLAPGTTRHYRVVGGGTASADATFRTAPPPGATGFRFYVLGDSRSGPLVFARIAERVRADVAERPERNQTFVVSVGDIVNNGNYYTEYGAQWFGPAAPLFARLPVLVAFGNHEDRNDPERSDLLLRAWLHEGGPKWRALTFGGLHLTLAALWDAGGFVTGAQADWMVETLAATATDPSVRWRLAALHELPWSVGRHGASERPAPDLRAHVHPRLRDAGVVAAFGGHNHLYARYEPVDGVHYVTTGTSGTPVHTGEWTAWAGGVLARQAPVPHWAAVDVEADSLTIRVFDETAAPLDVVTIGDDPADRPPVADGGPDVRLPGPGTAVLDGGASVDPESAPLAFRWSQVSGPALAELHDPTATATKVALPAAGRYVFALRVSDGTVYSAPDHVVAIVAPGADAAGGDTGYEPAGGGTIPVEVPFDVQCAAGQAHPDAARQPTGSGPPLVALFLLLLVLARPHRTLRPRNSGTAGRPGRE